MHPHIKKQTENSGCYHFLPDIYSDDTRHKFFRPKARLHIPASRMCRRTASPDKRTAETKKIMPDSCENESGICYF